MLCEKIVKQLNKQINLEFYSSNFYLQMSSWCATQGLDGCAAFLKGHATEEMEHMQRLFDYVNECGALAILGAIEAPPTEFANIKVVFEQTYEHECLITRAINDLVHAAFEARDYSTFNFLQWYVSEQHEEEKLFKGILDKLEIIGTKDSGLYHFDREMAQLESAPAEATEAA
jgi:ferritin